MKFVPVKIPFLVKKLFPNYVWSIPTDEKVLYLTFDDGPTPEITEWTLDILKKFSAKATFFCIGNNIEKHPSIFNRIQEEGHSFGNHTFHHPRGWKTKTEIYIEGVLRTEKVMSSVPTLRDRVQSENHVKNSSLITHSSKLFRPPYGQITRTQGKQLRKLGYKIIMWDVLAFDWMDTISKEKCAQNVISRARSGSIVVFHDSVKAAERMQYALPKVLTHFTEKGFQFRRIPE